MLSIFTIPKTFRGHVATIQSNALNSWKRLDPSCEVMAFAQDADVEAALHELGVRTIRNVATNDLGTPLVSDAFAVAKGEARNSILCYANCDIILMSDFWEAVQQVAALRRPFLMVGQRYDLDVTELLDMDTEWEERFRTRVQTEGKQHSPFGIDYFVFPRESLISSPPFAVGRPGWDNWMIRKARLARTHVIDASPAIMAVHQNHDYGHVPYGKDSYEGPEAEANRLLAGENVHWYHVQSATRVLTRKGLRLAVDPVRLRARFWSYIGLHPRFLRFLGTIKRALVRR